MKGEEREFFILILILFNIEYLMSLSYLIYCQLIGNTMPYQSYPHQAGLA